MKGSSSSPASLRARFTLGVVTMIVPPALFMAGALYSLQNMTAGFEEVVEEVAHEMQPVERLQMLLLRAAMSLNDHLIHDESPKHEWLARLSDDLDRAFHAAGPFHLAEERAVIQSAQDEWRRAETLARTLLALPYPQEKTDAVRIMRQMNAHIDRAVDALDGIHKVALRETEEGLADARVVKQRLALLMAGLLAVVLVAAVWGGITVTRAVFMPLSVLARTADRFAEGDLSLRVEAGRMPEEFGRLAGAFNAMAARLEESRAALEERASWHSALNQVAVAINSSAMGLQDILEEIMRQGVRLIGAKAACIAFYDEAAHRFINWVTRGLSEHFVRNMDFRPGGLADEAFTHGSYVLSNDRSETRHKLSRLAREEGLRSFVCLPLASHNSRLGVIYFYRADRDTFAPAEIELLATFASLTAQAIENARLYAQARELAKTDTLTGLDNRREFQRRLDGEIERSRRYARPLSLLMLDIDHFKVINDTYGHPAGDEVLRTLAGLIRRALRPADQPARYGGEEFAVILPETPAAGAHAVAERLRGAIAAAPFALGAGTTVYPTVSIGVAGFLEDADAGPALVAAADRALYAAKKAGRNCVRASSAVLDAERRQ